MPPSAADVTVLGYGSLMSGLGLQPFGRLRVRGVSRVTLSNARRGFAKFSQHGDRFAMALEPLDATHPLRARLLAAKASAVDAPEGLAFLLSAEDFASLCEREGYSPVAVQRLRDAARRRGLELAEFLWALLLEDADADTARFRQHLFRLADYTSPHYIPHPVPLDGDHIALTFLAPGREGSGAPQVIPVRVRTGNDALMTAVEAWRRKPNHTQLAYFATCLLGGVHGICVRDVLGPLAADPALAAHLRDMLATEGPAEIGRFLDHTGLDHSAYGQAFGAVGDCIRRSGLAEFLADYQ